MKTVQNRYNLFECKHDEVVDNCKKQGIIFIPCFPLGSARHLFPVHLMETLDTSAKQYNCTPYLIALTWLLKRSPFMLPIPGTLSIQHLLNNHAAFSIELSPADFEALSAYNEVCS